MTLLRGEVVLIRVPFHQTAGGKVRPALVVLDSGDGDFLAAQITSQPRASKFDLSIARWREAGLNVPSSVRAHKLAVLAKTDVVRGLGCLDGSGLKAVLRTLCHALCPKRAGDDPPA